MTVVWISDTNYHKILRTFNYLWISPRIIVHLRSYIQNSTQCFIRYPDTSKLVLKNSAAPRFSTHFSVSGYRMKDCVSFWIQLFRERLSEKSARDNPERSYGIWSIHCFWHRSCRTNFWCFALALGNIVHGLSCHFFKISMKSSDLKTTRNTFRDCRVHFFGQPFWK